MARDPYGGNFKLARAPGLRPFGRNLPAVRDRAGDRRPSLGLGRLPVRRGCNSRRPRGTVQSVPRGRNDIAANSSSRREPVRDRPQHHKEYSIMQYRFRISGTSALLMHNGAAGLDTPKRCQP